MAGLGFKDFAVGEVLTAADVDGYLMQQTVMRFADAAARGSALGTATGTAVALAEGMVTYLDDTNSIEFYTGTGWNGVGGFTASTVITATDASWSVPTLADPVVRVTVVGGGGGGGGWGGAAATAGGSSSFASSAGTATATGGVAAFDSNGVDTAGANGKDGLASMNGGQGGLRNTGDLAHPWGGGGQVTVAYFDLTGVTTANVTVGSGGTGQASASGGDGGDGGDGVVIVEYRAG